MAFTSAPCPSTAAKKPAEGPKYPPPAAVAGPQPAKPRSPAADGASSGAAAATKAQPPPAKQQGAVDGDDWESTSSEGDTAKDDDEEEEETDEDEAYFSPEARPFAVLSLLAQSAPTLPPRLRCSAFWQRLTRCALPLRPLCRVSCRGAVKVTALILLRFLIERPTTQEDEAASDGERPASPRRGAKSDDDDESDSEEAAAAPRRLAAAAGGDSAAATAAPEAQPWEMTDEKSGAKCVARIHPTSRLFLSPRLGAAHTHHQLSLATGCDGTTAGNGGLSLPPLLTATLLPPYPHGYHPGTAQISSGQKARGQALRIPAGRGPLALDPPHGAERGPPRRRHGAERNIPLDTRAT